MWFLVDPTSHLRSFPFIVLILISKASIKCEKSSGRNYFSEDRDCSGLHKLFDLLSNWQIREEVIIFQQHLRCFSNLTSFASIKFSLEDCPSLVTSPSSRFCVQRPAETIVIYMCPAETVSDVIMLI